MRVITNLKIHWKEPTIADFDNWLIREWRSGGLAAPSEFSNDYRILRDALANCSCEGVDEQFLRFPIPENKSVARESPGVYANTGLSVEEHLPLSERVVRRAKRHDSVPVIDEQQVSAEQEPAVNGEADARERHEAQWEWREPQQRHRCVMWQCDKRDVIASGARDFIEPTLQSHIARVAQFAFCTHFEHVHRRVPSSFKDQHTWVAHRKVIEFRWIMNSGVETLHFEPFARVAAQRHQLIVVISQWLHEEQQSVGVRVKCNAVHVSNSTGLMCGELCGVQWHGAQTRGATREQYFVGGERTHAEHRQVFIVGAAQVSLRNAHR